MIFCLLSSCLYADKAETLFWKEIVGWQIRVDEMLGNGCFVYQLFEENTALRLGIIIVRFSFRHHQSSLGQR